MDTEAIATIRRQISLLHQTNLRVGRDASGREYRYLCPSPTAYRWQWFWDSCFHAVMMAHVDPNLALAELRTLVSSQREDGFIGHINFWGSHLLSDIWGRIQSSYAWRQRHTALIQPPVLAQAIERVAQVLHDTLMPVEFLPALDRYHQWLTEHRTPDADGLLVIISPYESGMDQSPVYDEALGLSHRSAWRVSLAGRWLDLRNAAYNYDQRLVRRGPFRVKDVLVNALYADSLTSMARLHQRYGQPGYARGYAEKAAEIVEAMLTKMRDRTTGAFHSLYGSEDRRTKPITVASLAPLVVESLPREAAEMLVDRHITRSDGFGLPFPLPSVAASEPSFDTRGVRLSWRGPTWVNTNWLIWRGLVRHGYLSLAAQLAQRTIQMVATAGMREFYHPYTGRGMGARSFAWSGLALDMVGPQP